MRVALYHPWIYLRGGGERTILEYVRRSRHDWTLYTHHYDPQTTFPGFSELDVVELTPRIAVRRSFGPLVRAAATIASARIPPGSRALMVSSESVGDFVLMRNRLPALCYCLTPLKILHDPYTRKALAQRDPSKAAALRIMGPLFERVQRRVWRRYAHVFADSEEVRRRIVRGRLAPEDRVEVLHPGVDAERFAFNPGARDDVFLVPGRVMYTKNIELAIDAFAAARAGGLRSRLVVAGAVDDKSKDYFATLRRRAADLPVSFETDLDDGRLAELMQRSLAVVFPSRNEDFGIVPLEAMATGAPVLAVDSGGPRETILDGKTGWLLEAAPESFARRMLEVERDAGSLAPLRSAARDRAAEFSWERFAKRVDDAIDEYVSGRRDG